VREGRLSMSGLPQEVADQLAAGRILTVEHRIEGIWWQLSHDRFAYAVTMSDRAREQARDARQDPAGDPGSARDWRRTADANVLQADSARASGNPAEVERYLRAALSIFYMLEDHYSAAHLLTAIAELRFAAGDYDEAADLSRQAVERAPGDVAALTGLGYAQWQAGSAADAEATFSQALRLDSGAALALAGRGQIRADLGRYEYALHDLDQALRLTLAREAEADARSARALALAGLDRVPEAERELLAAFQLDPDRARTRLRAGRMAAIGGHWDEVRAEIERALSGRPSLSSVERESAERMMQRIR
jgi:tetratricopeptide (TPR) repeat protein